MATSAQLLALFRQNPVDSTPSYRWSDAQVYGWLSEGQREACIRAKLIKDTTTESVCEIAISSGTATYQASGLIIRVDAAFWVDSDGARIPLDIVDRVEADRLFPDWRTTSDTPTAIIHEGTSITLNRVPAEDATLFLEVLRLPVADIAASVAPEIPAVHHEELVSWALYRALLIEDDDDEKPTGRWSKYLARFEAYFGKKPNADLRRKQMSNRPHSTKAWW